MFRVIVLISVPTMEKCHTHTEKNAPDWIVDIASYPAEASNLHYYHHRHRCRRHRRRRLNEGMSHSKTIYKCSYAHHS